jgi:heptosyltransferase-2
MSLFISPKKIIVRMPNWIGDCTMATASLAALREKFPKSHITAMIKDPLGALLEKNPYIDEVLSFDKKKFSFFPKICKKIKKEQYDLGILLTNSFSSTYLFWKAKIPFVMGYENIHRKWLIDYSVMWPKKTEKLHIVDVYKALLSSLGKEFSFLEKSPELFVKKSEITAIKKRLKSSGYSFNKPLIIIHPGASYGPAKRWVPERYQQLAEKCSEKNFVIFVGDQQSKNLFSEGVDNSVDKKQKLIKNNQNQNTQNWMGKTSLRELISLLSLSSVVISSDSGPMHMASALKRPVVALFGPTNPIKSAPYTSGIVIEKKEKCSPCFQKTCRYQFQCMKNIQVDEVFQKIQEVLQQSC